jgi:transcriptional regulator with XRE-family HTH domain
MGKKLAMRLGKKLRKLRRDKDMSRKELAKASGVSKGRVRDYEQGNQKLSFKKGVRLASALGVSCELLAGVVVKKPKKSGAKE